MWGGEYDRLAGNVQSELRWRSEKWNAALESTGGAQKRSWGQEMAVVGRMAKTTILVESMGLALQTSAIRRGQEEQN